MSTYRLFHTTNGPSSAVSYSGSFIAGVLFEVTQGGCWFEGYWWWVADNAPTSPQKFGLWNVTYNADPVANIPAATVTSGTLTTGWNFIPLPTPIQLSIGGHENEGGENYSGSYVAATGINGNFPDTNSQFGSGGPYAGGIVNGPLTAFSDQSGSLPGPLLQGLFTTSGSDPTLVCPEGGSSSSNFWVDVQISDTPPTGYTGSYRLWPNLTALPGSISNDTNQQTTANEFVLSQSCTLNNIWFYSPPGAAVLPTQCAIWNVATQAVIAGTANASPSWTGAAGSGWVACAYSGVMLPAGDYKASVYSAGGQKFYQENTHYFSSPQALEEDVVKSLAPAAWWELNDAVGSSTAADSSGNGHTGTVHGAVTFGGSGPLQGGMTAAFDGSTGYISTGLNVSPTWTGLSLAAWVQIPAGGTEASGVVGNNNIASAGGANLQVYNSSGALGVQFNISTSAGVATVEFGNGIGVAWGDGKWHHVAVTWSGSSSTATCYLDATQVGTTTVTGTLTAGSADVTVGVAGGNYFEGSLTQVLVTTSAITAADINSLHDPAAYATGPGWNGITAGPLYAPSILKGASVTGNSTNLAMTGNGTYSTYGQGFIYPTLFDVNDGGENRWVDVEVTPGSAAPPPPPPTPPNSSSFLVFFP